MINQFINLLNNPFDFNNINNFERFVEFINQNKKEILLSKGKDSDGRCPLKKICFKYGKKYLIEQILNLEPQHTRFPFLKKIVNFFPFILNCIPSFFYNKIYSFCWDNLGCPYLCYLIPDNLEKIKYVYDHFSDEKSKQSFLAALMTRITHNFLYINYILEKSPAYFIEGFRDLKDEVFVDCGAFIGDTFEDYLKNNSLPLKYYFYEMNQKYITRIEQTLKMHPEKINAIIRPFGVSDKSENKNFIDKGMGTFITNETFEDLNTKNVVQTVSLDDDISEKVTFIKMDIEGFETAALNGASKIISEYNPKLAISVYHRIYDLWEIPYLIMKKYKYETYLFRQHKKNAIDDAIFYAK